MEFTVPPEIRQSYKERTGVELTHKRLRELVESHPVLGNVAPPSPAVNVDVPDREAEIAMIRQAAGTSRRSRMESLEQAAQALLTALEPGHQDIVKNTMLDMKWPAWVLFCGAVARACDNRELNVVDRPEWLNQSGNLEAVVVERFCEFCHLRIPNARRGQLFCCSNHGSDKPEHSLGCPAAVLAGNTAGSTPLAASAPPVNTVAGPLPVGAVPEGFCTLPGCGVKIVNARRGQQRCCNSHGSDKPEHSPGCESYAAHRQGPVVVNALEVMGSVKDLMAPAVSESTGHGLDLFTETEKSEDPLPAASTPD